MWSLPVYSFGVCVSWIMLDFSQVVTGLLVCIQNNKQTKSYNKANKAIEVISSTPLTV